MVGMLNPLVPANALPTQILRPATRTSESKSNEVESSRYVSVAKVLCRQKTLDTGRVARYGQCVVINTNGGFTIYFGDIPFEFQEDFFTDRVRNLLKSLYPDNYTGYSYISGVPERIYGIDFHRSSAPAHSQIVYVRPSTITREFPDSPWNVSPFNILGGLKAYPTTFELEFVNYEDALRFFYPLDEK